MGNKLTTGEELAAFALGAIPSFLINAAVTKNKIDQIFDFINLPMLAAAFVVTLIQIYWRLKKIEASKPSNILFASLVGWFLGAWIVSRFVNA